MKLAKILAENLNIFFQECRFPFVPSQVFDLFEGNFHRKPNL